MNKELSDIEIASRIALKFLRSKIITIKLVGNGVNNKNFLVQSKETKIIVKLSTSHKEHRALEDYKKEKWCIQKITARGIPSPWVLDVGKYKKRAYMIQTFVLGKDGKKVKDKLHIFYELGKYAKIIHSIKTYGFGERQGKKLGNFKQNWRKYVNYNINSLTNNRDDKLIVLNALNISQSKKVKEIFKKIKNKKYQFGLNHGDLVLWNTLVEKSGKVNLLDWEFSESHVIPHFDFICTLRLRYDGNTKPKKEEWNQFLQGYNMSIKQFEKLRPEIYHLALLISVDRLRWVIEHSPSSQKLKKYTNTLKKMLELNKIK